MQLVEHLVRAGFLGFIEIEQRDCRTERRARIHRASHLFRRGGDNRLSVITQGEADTAAGDRRSRRMRQAPAAAKTGSQHGTGPAYDCAVGGDPRWVLEFDQRRAVRRGRRWRCTLGIGALIGRSRARTRTKRYRRTSPSSPSRQIAMTNKGVIDLRASLSHSSRARGAQVPPSASKFVSAAALGV